MEKKKGSIKTKVLIYPLIAVLIGIIIIGGLSAYFTRKSLLSEMKTQGLLTSKRMVNRIADNNLALETIDRMLEDKIRAAARIVYENEDKLSNEYLKQVTENVGVDELYWYSPDGIVTYSTVPSYLGWEVPTDHSLNAVVEGKEELMEDIRKDADRDLYLKYGSVRNEKGNFVQAGIYADNVKKLTEKFSYQTLVEEIAKDDEIIYATVLDRKAVITASNDLEDIGTKEDDIGSITGAVDGKEYTSVYYADWIDEDVYDVVYPLKLDGKHVGAINIGYSMASVRSAIKQNIMVVAGIGLIVFIILGTLLYIFSNQIIVAINKLKEVLKKMASGNFCVSIDEKLINKNDEIGEISQGLSIMKDSVCKIVDKITNQSNELSNSAEKLTTTTNQVSIASDEVARTIEEIADGASDQANETTEGAAEMNKLGDIIGSEIELVKILNNSAKTVDTLKEEGFEVLKDLEQKTNQNNNAASEVQEIIIDTNENADKIEAASDMIKNIAEQTNLLALNASIEAARAGEAGKGFAVVADEIRKLAEETNQFAEEISDTIASLSKMTNKGVETMEEAGKIVKAQMESLDNTNDKFEGISKAIEDVRNVVLKLNKSTDKMMDKKTQIINVIENLSAISEENAASTEEVSASVEEQTASISQISKATEDLSELAEEMEKNISNFEI
ncbi:MAG: methyl-accepting chemotaxis protein [Bacillota bacterium]